MVSSSVSSGTKNAVSCKGSTERMRSTSALSMAYSGICTKEKAITSTAAIQMIFFVVFFTEHLSFSATL